MMSTCVPFIYDLEVNQTEDSQFVNRITTGLIIDHLDWITRDMKYVETLMLTDVQGLTVYIHMCALSVKTNPTQNTSILHIRDHRSPVL